MNFNMDNNYKGNYYNAELCRFIGLHPSKLYYKSYIVRCLMNKLEYKYGRYALNDAIIQIMNNNNINLYWNHNMSKAQLTRMISQLQINHPDNSIYLVLKINEEGNNTAELVI